MEDGLPGGIWETVGCEELLVLSVAVHSSKLYSALQVADSSSIPAFFVA